MSWALLLLVVLLAWDDTFYTVITTAYLIFWGPLFAVTLVNWDWDYEDAKESTAHEVNRLKLRFIFSTLILLYETDWSLT